MMAHADLKVYYDDNPNALPPENWNLAKSQLSSVFFAADRTNQDDIKIIIVEEEGQPLVLSPNALDDDAFGSAVGTVNRPLYAVVNTYEFENNAHALSVAVYSLLASPDLVTYQRNSKGRISNYSLLGYWLEEDKVDNSYASPLSLSVDNTSQLQCNLAKMQIESAATSDLKRTFGNITGQVQADATSAQVLRPRPVTPDQQHPSMALTVVGNGSIALGTGVYTDASAAVCIPPTFRSGFAGLSAQYLEAQQQLNPGPEPLEVYPNPFFDGVNIRFAAHGQLQSGQPQVELVVYDLRGLEVDRVELQSQPMGNDKAGFRYQGAGLPSGGYLFRLHIGNKVQVGRLIKQ